MDKAAYLARKRMLADESVTYPRERLCYACHWLAGLCRCPWIKPFATRSRFVILMHPKEARRERLGTGRLCKAALPDSEIIVGVDYTHDARVNALIADPANLCMVLYPGERSLDISSHDVAPLREAGSEGRRLTVFLIDGTWQCAKKMMTQSLNVRALPRISFAPAGESIFEIKEQPAAWCLSTLESIHRFLCEADRRGIESLPGRPQDTLLDVFRSMIDFSLKCAADPAKSSYRGKPGGLGYTPRALRKKRKPGSGRRIVLND
jgi:DTW domain-containing protein YfiP